MEKQAGIFNGCASCKKHCCLLRREKTKMILYISGKEYEQIERLVGKTDKITTMPDGRIFVNWNEEGFCPFVNDQGCTLGELKPLPCRFYPYGIMLKNNKYYLIRWTNICETFTESNDQNEYDSLYDLIYPGIKKRAFDYKYADKNNFVIVQEVPRGYLG